ncbi:MAG: helix-turn-helix domain-containing protein [Eubacteriales bacterium]|jgi:transcriptional regulator with XRE-family HTH domain|nr:helix-turn-helix transcriptional regulator [Clostridiales bacterium]
MASSESDRSSAIEKFGATLAELRVRRGLTQAALAQQLGVTHQAVSQWECGDTMPDILLLPKLAGIFGVSIDNLFGGPEPIQADIAREDIPQDDGKLRAVLFIGNNMVKSQKIMQVLAGDKRIVFKYQGPALNVESHMSLECGDVGGNATAAHSMRCGDVKGSAKAGHSMNCQNVGQDASAGHAMTVGGDVGGDAKAGHSLTCGNVAGNVKAGHSVNVKGSVGGSLKSR